ncbi:MAG TPA: hypothetical protein PLM98_04435, partial [Thiolinea sp.]|nr:hypothetical protein [Thiolinea sp.]
FSYLQKITIDPQDRVYVEDLYYNKASSNYKERIQIFSSEGSFLAIPQQTWPSFDKQGNTYRTVHKLDLATNEYDYFLQKTDINQQTQEWPLNYKSTYADYGLSVSSTYPCIHSISIDTQKNIYLLRCYSSASYHDSHHPIYTIKISLQKIDPNNGRVLAEKEILNNQNEFESTLPSIKMSIDEQDFIYLQHEPSYLFSGQSLLDPDENITVFDTNFNKLGIYLNTATATSVYSANNQLYVTDSVINIYELASSLKAPILMNVRPLDNQGLAQIYWQDRTTDETGFKIYRCKVVDLSCSDFQLVKTLKANVNSARLAAPADFTVGSSYRYKLTAIKGKEESLTYNVMQIKF